MRLFVVRHGQSAANLSKTYAGHTDVTLTEQGCMEAQAIQPILADIPFDKVYSSDLRRALDTQKLALPGKDSIQLPLLREIDVGSLAGMSFAQARQDYAEQFCQEVDYAYFGGETLEEIRSRAAAFLRLLEEDPCETAIAFSHNGFICSLLECVLKTPVYRPAVFSGNCAVHVFDFDGKCWRLTAWNYMKKI